MEGGLKESSQKQKGRTKNMKFNDQKEVEIKSTKKKEEKSEEKKNLAAGDVKDALVGGVKGFYTVKDKKLRRKRILLTIGELFLVYISGMISVSYQPAKLFGEKDYSFFNCIGSFFSFVGIAIFILSNVVAYFAFHWFLEKSGRGEDYRISKNGTYGTAKLLNDTEDEAEALKRIPIDQLDDPEIDGNILGYMEDTKEVIVKDVHGNANRNIAVCGGPGTGKSRTLVRNIIFQCVRRGESIFITDPKGEMAESMAKYLKKNDYIVKYYNLKNFEASDSFNCLQGLNNEEGHAFINVLADIIMKNTAVGENVVMDKAIVAEDVVIGNNVVIGCGEEVPNVLKPAVYSFGLVAIGENSVIPDSVKIGKNTAIAGVTTKEDYPDGELAAGQVIAAKDGGKE